MTALGGRLRMDVRGLGTIVLFIDADWDNVGALTICGHACLLAVGAGCCICYGRDKLDMCAVCNRRRKEGA